MEAAKAAVNKITRRSGHKTDVDEYVNPAVVSETVKPHRHEEIVEAVDKEVHQDHYHTTVQPIAAREVAPEKHVHNLAPQIEREFRHDNEDETRRRVEAELSQFKNTSRTAATTVTQQAAGTVAGEHVHHHVHETVQPVIHKETIKPEVVHTTVPIHEIHQASAQHHGISALPMKTLDEFTKTGAHILDGKAHHTHEQYDGPPRPYNEKLATTLDKVLPSHHDSNTTGTTSAGLGSNTMSSGLGSNTTSSGHHHSNPIGNDRADSGVGGFSNGGGVGSNKSQGKPSLADKLNPRVDADGDGKAGFMK